MVNNSVSKYNPVKFSIVRIAVVALLLFLLVSVEFAVYSTAISDFHSNLMKEYEMTDNKGWQKSLAWMLDEFGLWMPTITICVFLFAVYKRYNREDGILQREMGFEIVLLGVLVYAVLLPAVINYSDDVYEAEVLADTVRYYEGGDAITVIRESLEWFVRFIIPVGLLSLYHFTRAKAEIEESET